MINLKRQLQEILEQFRSFGFDTEELVFAPPAKLSEIQDLEQTLGFPLPPSLRDILLTISGHVDFQWSVPHYIGLPKPFDSINGVHLHWSVEFIRSCNEAKNTFVNNVFPYRSDPYASIWRNKLAFYKMWNCDYWAIDLDPTKYEQVTYLRRINNYGKTHGYVLAENFQELLRRWTPLACPGTDEQHWMLFTNGLTTPIDPDCPNAKAWRKLLKIAT